MPAFWTALAFATAASGAVVGSLPPRIGTAPGTSSLHQVRNPRFVRNGPAALAKAYRKYKAPIPADLHAVVHAAAASSRRSKGSVVVTPEDSDAEYLTPVSIGTPGQTLNLDFDSGSSDLWVFSSETPSRMTSGQTVYSPSKSNTSKKLPGASWQIQYGDGSSSSGDVYLDTVTIGGLAVTGQAVETAEIVSDEFTSDSANDGLLGLAFGALNTVEPTPQRTFFQNAGPKLDKALFTADLKHGKPGHYNFGYIDSNAHSGAITYTAVDNSTGFWEFTSPGYAVGSSSFQSTSITGIADTGTTLLLLPSAIVSDYYQHVSGARYQSSEGGYVFSCDASLPDFSFRVEDATVTVPGAYINYGPASGDTCYGGIQSDTGIGYAIFGDMAMKAAFVVFDADSLRLGWASKDV